MEIKVDYFTESGFYGPAARGQDRTGELVRSSARELIEPERKLLEVENHELEPQCFEDARKLGSHVGFELRGTFHFFADLDAHHFAVVRSSKLPEARPRMRIFPTFDDAAGFHGYTGRPLLPRGMKRQADDDCPRIRRSAMRTSSRMSSTIQTRLYERSDRMVLLRSTLSRDGSRLPSSRFYSIGYGVVSRARRRNTFHDSEKFVLCE